MPQSVWVGLIPSRQTSKTSWTVNLAQAKQKLAQIKFDDLNAQKDQLTQQIEQINSQLADAQDKTVFFEGQH